MKKITLVFALIATIIAHGQISTGEIEFATDFTASIDISETDVTITMVNDENRWMAIGFDTSSMTMDKDIVSYDSSGVNDRRFIGIGSTPPTDTQDWTTVSDEVSSGLRTVVITRPLAGSDETDFTFDPEASSLSLVWARGSSLSFIAHGQANRGATTVQFTLGVDGVLTQTVSLFPVPASDILSISLQNVNYQDAKVTIYNTFGALVLHKVLDHKSVILDVSSLSNGMYVVKVNTQDGGVLTTKFLKE